MKTVFIDDSGHAGFNDPNILSLGINAIVIENPNEDDARKKLKDCLNELKREAEHFKWSSTKKTPKDRQKFFDCVVKPIPFQIVVFYQDRRHASGKFYDHFKKNRQEYYLMVSRGLAERIVPGSGLYSIIHDDFGTDKTQELIKQTYEDVFRAKGASVQSFQFKAAADESLLVIPDMLGGFIREVYEVVIAGGTHPEMKQLENLLNSKAPIVEALVLADL